MNESVEDNYNDNNNYYECIFITIIIYIVNTILINNNNYIYLPREKRHKYNIQSVREDRAVGVQFFVLFPYNVIPTG